MPALQSHLAQWALTAALPARTATHLAIVIDEWLSNIEKYGTPPGDAAHKGVRVSVTINCIAASGTLEIRLFDDGQRFDPTTIAAPERNAPLDQRTAGGLGLYLMRQLTQQCQYRTIAGGNELRLTKLIDKPGEQIS